MAIVLRDFITFPFNAGRGLRTNQLDGEVTRSQLHDDVGMPVYSGLTTYDSGGNKVMATLSQLGTNVVPPLPSLLFLPFPSVIDRKAEALTLNAGTVEFPLHAVSGEPLMARDLTPGTLYGVIRSVDKYILIEPMMARPQDYEIVAVFGSTEPQEELAESDLSTTRVAVSQTNIIDLTAAIVSAAMGQVGRSRRYVWLGVPADAPGINGNTGFLSTRERALSPDFANFSFAFQPYTTVTPGYNGVPYQWWRSVSQRLGITTRESWIALRFGGY